MRGPRLRAVALALIVLGLMALALVPQYPGFWVCLSTAGWLALLIYGPSKLRSDLASLFRPPRRSATLRAVSVVLVVSGLMGAGVLGSRLPVFNLAGPVQAALEPSTLDLVRKIESETTMEAFVSRADREARAKRLLDLYQRGSSKIKASVSRAESKAMDEGGGLRLAPPDSVVIASGAFREVVSPISQTAINASLRRLIAPNRLVLNLMGDGEKSALDASPMGLSRWADSLQASKIHLKDCHWAGPALPPEAWAAHALILAGPRRPLGEEREAALMDYLAKGGKLMILQDPMVVGFGSGALAPLGLAMPWGLVVDPDATWAGTEDFFIISRDFPAHPATLGLTQPVVWPLAGAVAAAAPKNSEASGAGASKNGPSAGEVPESGSAEAAMVDGEGVGGGSANPGPPASDPLSHTWSVALSSGAAWLETDRASLADRSHRYQAKLDLPGPVTLASATSVAGGGRLFLAADADLAANGFISYAGNMAFLDNALYWLMGAQDELAPPSGAIWLDLTHAKARALFWIPIVIWPAAALLFWFRRHVKRRRQSV